MHVRTAGLIEGRNELSQKAIGCGIEANSRRIADKG